MNQELQLRWYNSSSLLAFIFHIINYQGKAEATRWKSPSYKILIVFHCQIYFKKNISKNNENKIIFFVKIAIYKTRYCIIFSENLRKMSKVSWVWIHSDSLLLPHYCICVPLYNLAHILYCFVSSAESSALLQEAGES